MTTTWKWMARIRNLLTLSFIALGTSAHAAVIMPESYSMLNGQGTGQGGLFDYLDSSYNGSGDPASEGAQLSGGLGKLTDGVVGVGNWITQPEDYVGWKTLNPEITFNFADLAAINSVAVHVNNQIEGGVGIFSAAVVEVSTDGQNYELVNVYEPTVVEKATNAAFYVNIPVNESAKHVRIAFEDGDFAWQFISEVQFDGVFVPEPQFGVGLFATLLLLVRHRRRR
ncbi:MAG: hypothetical protein R3C28_22570 [Pirellulaceae bacterium]